MTLCSPANPVRLIALDLDGTLLTSDRQIHPHNLVAIARAIEAGITIVLASGRIRPSITPFGRALNLNDGPFICSNGAHIVDSLGKTVSISHLSPEIRSAVTDFSVREKFHINGYSTDEMFYVESDSWLDLYRLRAKWIPSHQVSLDELKAMDLVKLMIIGEPDRIRSIAFRGPELFDTNLVTLTESEPEYLEFLPAQVNKGIALAQLSEHLGIARENVMAVGDYLNDLEMISWAGHGVAMGNAVQEVKDVARAVTAINNDAGVAKAIASVLP